MRLLQQCRHHVSRTNPRTPAGADASDRSGLVYPPLGRDGTDMGHQPDDGRDSRVSLHYGKPQSTDDVMERLNISRGIPR